MAYYDRGYRRAPVRPRVSDPATYYSSTPRLQPPAVARWHTHLRGLETSLHEICGLGFYFTVFFSLFPSPMFQEFPQNVMSDTGQGEGSSTTSNSRHFMAVSLLKTHQIFMLALAKLRCVKTRRLRCSLFPSLPLWPSCCFF